MSKTRWISGRLQCIQVAYRTSQQPPRKTTLWSLAEALYHQTCEGMGSIIAQGTQWFVASLRFEAAGMTCSMLVDSTVSGSDSFAVRFCAVGDERRWDKWWNSDDVDSPDAASTEEQFLKVAILQALRRTRALEGSVVSALWKLLPSMTNGVQVYCKACGQKQSATHPQEPAKTVQVVAHPTPGTAHVSTQTTASTIVHPHEVEPCTAKGPTEIMDPGSDAFPNSSEIHTPPTRVGTMTNGLTSSAAMRAGAGMAICPVDCQHGSVGDAADGQPSPVTEEMAERYRRTVEFYKTRWTACGETVDTLRYHLICAREKLAVATDELVQTRQELAGVRALLPSGRKQAMLNVVFGELSAPPHTAVTVPDPPQNRYCQPPVPEPLEAGSHLLVGTPPS